MGQGISQALGATPHEFHDLAARRRGNRAAFSTAVAEFRAELPEQPPLSASALSNMR